MRKQKEAPAHRARWWRPARPPAVLWVAAAACLLTCWVATEADGAPNKGSQANKVPDWCSNMRDVIFRNLLAKQSFRPTAFPRPTLCNVTLIKELMMGTLQECESNTTASDLWDRVCGVKRSARGGSGVNSGSSGATGRRADTSKLKKVTSLMKKVACKPRIVLENVTKDPGEEHYFFEPCQVRVKRCTGCCNNDGMACLPTMTQTKKVTVLKMTNYGSLGNASYSSNSEDFVKKDVVHHKRCACQCKVQETHCTPPQEHDPYNCRCRCPDEAKKTCSDSTKHFNETTCACECLKRKRCSTGMSFNNNTCRCG